MELLAKNTLAVFLKFSTGNDKYMTFLSSTTNLNVIQVDDGSSNVGQQIDKVILVFTHQVGDLIKHYLDPLIIPENVDIHICCRAMPCKIARQDFQLKVPRIVRCEEVVGPDDSVCKACGNQCETPLQKNSKTQ